MIRLAVKGIGVIGGFGCGVADLERALADGAGRPESIAVPTAQGPVELPAFRAATDRLDDFVARRSLRRIDHYSKMGLLGASLALADAGMPGADHRRTGVIIASGYGASATTVAFLDSIISDGDVCASPTHFANSVHNAAAANISIMLGITGPSLTVSQFDLSVPSALLSARQWLAEGRVDRVLLGGVDELSELLGYTWLRSRGNRGKDMAPLRTMEETAVMGEGAAFLLLSRAEGDGEGYCTIDEVAMGSLPGAAPPVPADALLLLGADGRRELGGRYRGAVPAGSRIACYTSLYGCMPVGPAFDLAAAALILKGGAVFPTPGGAGCDLPGSVAAPGGSAFPRVACLRLAGDSDYGVVTLGRI